MSARALFNASTCVFLEVWTGRSECLLPVLGIAGEYCKKIGEKMQAHARGPLGVTREAVGTYERPAGFQGVRKIMVEHIVRVLVPFQGVIQPPWRPAPAWAFGNSGRYLNHAVAFFRNRANPAATRRGGAS